MLNAIGYQLSLVMLQCLSTLYYATYYWGGTLSFLAGILMPVIYFDKPERIEQDTVFRRLIIIVSLLLFLFGTLSNVTVPMLASFFHLSKDGHVITLTYSSWQYGLIPFFLLAVALHVVVRRQLSPALNRLSLRMTQRTKAAREERTDVRNVRDLLPETVDYDPEKHIKLKRGIFVGLDVEHQPQYIPLSEIQKQHADILGTTGAGKGVASGLILYQLILANEGVFVLDPKNDEWAPHLMRLACEKAKKPFHLIDLNKPLPQLNLLADATPEHIEELLVAGFSFAEKGDIADFYRIDDRKAARKAPQKATEEERKTFIGLFNSDYVQNLKDTVKAFFGKMEELSEVHSINAPDGLNMQSIFKDGGCCYIVGSLRNSKIIIAQKMILIRLFQLAEMRDRVNSAPKPVAIFLDEFKYHISKAAIEGLGAARDKGLHLLLAHQSVADLRDCPADLNSDAVVGAVVENTKFKLVYKLQDPETAEWIAKMSGTILVDDETRYVESNSTYSEIIEHKRNIRLAERYFVDTNMLLNLPPFVSYIFTAKEVPKPSLISPIKVTKERLRYFGQPKEKDTITPTSVENELQAQEAPTQTKDDPFYTELEQKNAPSIENQEGQLEPQPEENPTVNAQETYIEPKQETPTLHGLKTDEDHSLSTDPLEESHLSSFLYCNHQSGESIHTPNNLHTEEVEACHSLVDMPIKDEKKLTTPNVETLPNKPPTPKETKQNPPKKFTFTWQ